MMGVPLACSALLTRHKGARDVAVGWGGDDVAAGCGGRRASCRARCARPCGLLRAPLAGLHRAANGAGAPYLFQPEKPHASPLTHNTCANTPTNTRPAAGGEWRGGVLPVPARQAAWGRGHWGQVPSVRAQGGCFQAVVRLFVCLRGRDESLQCGRRADAFKLRCGRRVLCAMKGGGGTADETLRRARSGRALTPIYPPPLPPG